MIFYDDVMKCIHIPLELVLATNLSILEQNSYRILKAFFLKLFMILSVGFRRKLDEAERYCMLPAGFEYL